MYSLKTPTSVLVVSLEDLKTQLRYAPSDTSQDSILTQKIHAARIWIERYCGISMLNQVYTSSFRGWSQSLPIEVAPYVSGLTINYKTDTSDTNPVAAADYEIYKGLQIHGVYLRYQSYPTLKERTLYPITMEYTSGYGAAADDVPADLREAVMILASTMDMNRVDTQMALGMVGHIINSYKTEYARAV